MKRRAEVSARRLWLTDHLAKPTKIRPVYDPKQIQKASQQQQVRYDLSGYPDQMVCGPGSHHGAAKGKNRNVDRDGLPGDLQQPPQA